MDSVFKKLKSEKVRLLDPSPYLCDKSQFCHGVEDGHALYFDFNHLSNDGIAKIAPMFTKMFLSMQGKLR